MIALDATKPNLDPKNLLAFAHAAVEIDLDPAAFMDETERDIYFTALRKLVEYTPAAFVKETI